VSVFAVRQLLVVGLVWSWGGSAEVRIGVWDQQGQAYQQEAAGTAAFGIPSARLSGLR